MPYKTTSELPEYVRRYSDIVQRQWQAVFNSTYEKVLRETKKAKDAEARAFRAANSILKKRFSKPDAKEKNSQHDFFQHMVDKYLGNLEG